MIIFKKPRKMTNDFFNNYIFVYTFQWTSSECQNNVTITVKVAMVTYYIYTVQNKLTKIEVRGIFRNSQTSKMELIARIVNG